MEIRSRSVVNPPGAPRDISVRGRVRGTEWRSGPNYGSTVARVGTLRMYSHASPQRAENTGTHACRDD